MRIVVGPHGFENHDQTTSHDSLLSIEFEPKKKKKKKRREKEEDDDEVGVVP